MLEHTTNENPRWPLGLIVDHTDTGRGYAYDKDAKISEKLIAPLKEAPKRGWIVIDMNNDWAEVFAD